MQVKKLSLVDFRNYKTVMLEFPSMLTVFLGKNAQGKTNLIETFYVLATGRSFRATRDAEMIRWGQETASIQAEIERLHGIVRINIAMRSGTAKRVQINGNPIRRLTDLFGYVNVVAFTPDDLQLVKGSPSYRRQFLDYEIAQVSPAYRDHLSRYNRILRQRNSLLRAIAEGTAQRTALQAWEEQFIEHGSRVVVKRAEMIQTLTPMAARIHSRITNGQEHLRIMYRPFFVDDENVTEEEREQWCHINHVRRIFAETLHRLRHVELRRGTSLVGPQRDDIDFQINGVDTRTYGSQGQQRTTVLSCKLAEIQFMEEEVGEPPILLLDDVMSELDTSRREFLVDVVKGRVQTFITSAHAGDVGKHFLKQADVFRIRQGEIIIDV